MTRDEADEMLRGAIIAHAQAYDLCHPGEMLNEYAVIAHWQPEVADGRSRYTTQFHQASVPNHIALGLFSAGEQLVWATEDDE